MDNIKVEITPGAEVSNEDLALINKYSRIKFKPGEDWDHKLNNHFHDRIFFLVKADDVLKSYGTLRDITLTINESPYLIKGIQGIASVEEGKGYGKILMQAMVNYANETESTIVGFCSPFNRPFYIKCGLKVKEGDRNFIYINTDKEEDSNSSDEIGDVIYYSAKDNEITKAIEQETKIFHLVPYW